MNVYLGANEIGPNTLGSLDIEGIYKGTDEVRASGPGLLCFTANTAGSTIKLAKNGSPTTVTLETSTDGRTWNTYTFGDTITLTNIGDKVYWRNASETDTGFSTSTANYYKFEIVGSIAGSGDINFLLNKNSTTTLSSYCYYRIFYGCTGLTSAPVLPATTLNTYCYNYMFYGCTGLTSAPELPATTLADICYAFMFQNCTGLTSAPELPATTLAANCYNSMLKGCTGLTTAPALPATTLPFNCYSGMFNGCTGLTTPPALPATTLDRGCYNNMFFGCTGLTTAPVLPATTLARNCYNGMFYNCTGLTEIPKLPATALVDGCYMSMFTGCSKIKLSTTQTGEYQTAYRIPASGTGTEDGLPLEYMFRWTGGTFTDTPTINTTYYTSNTVVSYKIIIDDDFTTATNAQLTAEGWLSIGDSYGLDASSNGLHWHTFETDTHSGIEFQVTDSLVGKKFYWELEGYRGYVDRWGNISFSLDRPANYSNKKKKYDVVAACAGWGTGLRSLPGEGKWAGNYQYSGVSSGTMSFRNGTSGDNIDMYGDKGNHGLKWQPYGEDYSLDLPFTLGIYKGRGYVDFGNWITHIEWETPDGTIKTFERDFTSDSQSSKDSLNNWLAGTDKYIRLTSNRGYGSSTYDKDYWRKAKIWYE